MSTQSRKLVRAAALVLGLTLSSAALAQDTGLYISGSIGQSRADLETSDFSAAGVTAISVDDTVNSWKLNLGYQFSRNWGLEFGFVDFGEFSLIGTLGAEAVSATADVTAWTLAVVGTLPLGNSKFSLFGKLGLARTTSDARTTIGAASFSGKDHDNDLFGGIGVRFAVNRNVGVQLEAEHYNFDDRIRLYTIGLHYKF